MDKFRQNIGWLRDRFNLSQEKFGKVFGLSRGQVESYERRTTEISVKDADKICKHFGITLDQFFNTIIDESNFDASEAKKKNEGYENTISELKRDKEDLRSLVKKLEDDIEKKKAEIKALQNKLPANPLIKGPKTSHS